MKNRSRMLPALSLMILSAVTFFSINYIIDERKVVIKAIETPREMHGAPEIELRLIRSLFDPKKINGVQGIRAYNDTVDAGGIVLAIASGYLTGADLFSDNLDPIIQNPFSLGKKGKTLFADVVRLSNGNYAYTDFKGNKIVVVDRSGKTVAEWSHLSLTLPIGIDILSKDTLVVVNYGADEILIIDENGKEKERVSHVGDIRLRMPYDVRVHSGTVYISDRTNHRIIVTDRAMRSYELIEESEDGKAYFNHPQHIEFDSRGLLYVMDTKSKSIKVIDPGSRSLIAILTHPQIEIMRGIALDTRDRIYLSGFRKDYPPNGELLTEAHSGVLVFAPVSDQIAALRSQ